MGRVLLPGFLPGPKVLQQDRQQQGRSQDDQNDPVRFDFFSADKTLVREVLLDEYVTFYRVSAADVSSTDIMQEWYDALAAAAGKKAAK